MDQTIALLDERRKRRMRIVRRVAAVVGAYACLHLCKQPRHTSEFTGAAWVRDILRGNSVRCYDMFRMELNVFHELCRELEQHGLREFRSVGIHEMVGIFLNTVGFALSSRLQQERFQRSGETIHRAMHAVLNACCRLAMDNIKPLDPQFENVHSKIRQSNRYWPFFKNAIGAIDGTHIPCKVKGREKTKYINRKGWASQNVMAVCDWDMCFTFVLAGWEGSAHDARVFDHAVTTPAMRFPHPPAGKFYLVDASYPTPTGYLGPYRSERYHLPDFQRSSRLDNANETFNYLHSSLRSTIERTFGVWKNKFAILRDMHSYKFTTQVKIVCATMAIHNFIRRMSISDPDFRDHEREDIVCADDDDDDDDDVAESSTVPSSVASSSDMASLRDSIRDQIWYYTQEG